MKIKERREQLGITQTEASIRARVAQAQWHRWETGKAEPIAVSKELIARVLETTEEEIFG